MCAVNGCTGGHHSEGLCHWHYVNGADPKLLRTPKPKPAKPSQPRMARKPKERQKPKVTRATGACCQECGAKNAVKAYRLDPRNLRPVHELLCTPCQKARGFAPVSYDRTMWTNMQTLRRSEQ